MHWSHHKLTFLWTGAMVLLSSNIGRHAGGYSAAANARPTDRHGTVIRGRSDGAAPAKRRSAPYRIYLTFDDGPSAGSQLVNTLSQKDSLPINVFLIGGYVNSRPSSRQLFHAYQANPFVEIGNHSYSHAERHYTTYFRNPDEVLADFDRSRDSLGQTNTLTRLPGRNFFRLDQLTRDDLNNGAAAADTLAAHGYRIFGWDLEWRRQSGKGFAKHTGKEMLDLVNEMVEKQKTFLPGRVIILLHDSELRDDDFCAELEEFIRLARADGQFRFEHLSTYTGE